MFSIAFRREPLSTRRARDVRADVETSKASGLALANPTGLGHAYQLRGDWRRGRGTKRRLRDGCAAGNGDYFDVDVDGRLCARRRDDARFSTRPERPYPVTDKTVEWMTILVNRGASDAMGSRVVPGAGRACFVAVIFVRHDS
jgi:hypothetical protein